MQYYLHYLNFSPMSVSCTVASSPFDRSHDLKYNTAQAWIILCFIICQNMTAWWCISMYSLILVIFGAPMIKFFGIFLINKTSDHFTKEPKVSGIPKIDSVKVVEFPWVMMMHPSVRDTSFNQIRYIRLGHVEVFRYACTCHTYKHCFINGIAFLSRDIERPFFTNHGHYRSGRAQVSSKF